MSGTANYKQPDVEQSQRVTLNFSELYLAEHPTNKLLRIIGELDLRAFDANYLNDKTGRSAFLVERLLA